MRYDMGKYEPLTEFLRKQAANEIQMTFAQIERVIGTKLPPKAQKHRAWWSNSPSNSVMTKAWLEAGFRSEQVDMEGSKLVFRKTVSPLSSDSSAAVSGEPSKRHPLIGWMKGTVHIPSGVDLTEPADPEWGERAWGDQKQ
jgi:hypothetical protein